MCGMDMPLDVIQVEFLRCSGVGVVEEGAPSIKPPSLHVFVGQLGQPIHNALKWACLQIVIALTSSPFAIIPIALSIILDPTHDWYLFDIGHGQYDQQQDVLVVTPYTWYL